MKILDHIEDFIDWFFIQRKVTPDVDHPDWRIKHAKQIRILNQMGINVKTYHDFELYYDHIALICS